MPEQKRQVVAAIIEQGGRFLLGKRSPAKKAAPGYWCPISGEIEPGETSSQAVVREVFEEVGLTVKPLEKICEFDTHDKTAIIHWWLVKVEGGTPRLKNDEHTELRWVSLKEMQTLSPFFKEDIEVFEKALKYLQAG